MGKTSTGDNELPLRQKTIDPKMPAELVAGLFNISAAMMKTPSKSREIARRTLQLPLLPLNKLE